MGHGLIAYFYKRVLAGQRHGVTTVKISVLPKSYFSELYVGLCTTISRNFKNGKNLKLKMLAILNRVADSWSAFYNNLYLGIRPYYKFKTGGSVINTERSPL